MLQSFRPLSLTTVNRQSTMLFSLDTVFLSLVTMTMPAFLHGRYHRNDSSDSVNGDRMECERTPCSLSSNVCPPWHYCNTHTRFCSPCSRCRDGVDNSQIPPANCQDPQFCIDSFHSSQDYACPWLRINDGFKCSGYCTPCGGPFGYFLGTTCRVDCDGGDSAVFNCIFLNEVAQWNIPRRPAWIQYVNFTLRETPTPDLTEKTAAAVKDGEEIPSQNRIRIQTVVVVVVTVMGVVVTMTVVVMTVVMAVRRRRTFLTQKPICKGFGNGDALLHMTAENSHDEIDRRPSHDHSRDDRSMSSGHESWRTTFKTPVENEAESIRDDDDADDNDDSGYPPFPRNGSFCSFLSLPGVGVIRTIES